MSKNHEKNGREAPNKVDEIEIAKPTWGTKAWKDDQTANTARFDYVLFPKAAKLEGKVEIRNIGGNDQSASTDHLPVDARVWVK